MVVFKNLYFTHTHKYGGGGGKGGSGQIKGSNSQNNVVPSTEEKKKKKKATCILMCTKDLSSKMRKVNDAKETHSWCLSNYHGGGIFA